MPALGMQYGPCTPRVMARRGTAHRCMDDKHRKFTQSERLYRAISIEDQRSRCCHLVVDLVQSVSDRRGAWSRGTGSFRRRLRAAAAWKCRDTSVHDESVFG